MISDHQQTESSAARKRKGKLSAPPTDISTLRRSNRLNKYDGFRTTSLFEAHPNKSKVKPRVIPSAATTTVASSLQAPSEEVPPPTAIPTM